MRRRLFLVTLAVTTLLVAAFAFPLALLVRDVARDRAITDAEQDLAALAPVLAVDPAPDGARPPPSSARRPARTVGFAVLLPDGTQIGDQTDARRRVGAAGAASSGSRSPRRSDDGIDVYGPVVARER